MPKKLVCLFLYLHAKTQQPTSGAFYQHPCKSDCWFWNLLTEKWGRSSQDSASLSKREEQGVSPLHKVPGNTNQLSRYLEGRKCHWNQWFTHSFNKCFIQCLTLCPTLLPGTKATVSRERGMSLLPQSSSTSFGFFLKSICTACEWE